MTQQPQRPAVAPPVPPQPGRRRLLLAAVLVVVLGAAILLPGLGGYALFDPWEAQYAQVAAEMAEQGSWLDAVYRDSERWFSKPLLAFWMLRVSYALFGVSEFAARLPVALCGVATLLVLLVLATRLYGLRVGLLSTLVLATSPQFVLLARQVMLDVPYLLFQTAALLQFALAARDTESWSARRRFLWFYALSALAVLTKGLTAVAIPVLAVALYVLVTWDWRFLKRIRLGQGALLFVLIAVPWFVYKTAQHGWLFLDEFVVYHHLERAAGLIQKPNDTFELYVKVLGFALFPWSAFLPFALVGALRWDRRDLDPRSRADLLLFLFTAVVFLGFTLSSTKFHHYPFPAVPLLALFIGRFLAGLGEPGGSRVELRLSLLLSALVLLVLANDLMTSFKPLLQLFVYGPYQGRKLPAEIQPYLTFTICFAAIGAVMLAGLLRRRLCAIHAGLLAVPAIVFLLVVNFQVVPPVAPVFSLSDLHRSYERNRTGPDAPVCDRNSWLRRSATFYFGTGVELFRDDAGAVRFLRKPGQRFCLVDKDRFPYLGTAYRRATGQSLYVIEERHPLTLLVSSQPTAEITRRLAEFVIRPADGETEAEVPQIARKLPGDGAILEDKIALLGWDLKPVTVRPGQSFELVYYFKCLRPMEADYQIFIHGDDPGEGARLHGDHPPARGLYPTSRWQPGEIIIDRHTLTVPRHKKPSTYTVRMGFYLGGRRMKVVSSVSTDGANRINTARVRVVP